MLDVFDFIRYSILRHFPNKKVQEHYQRKYQGLICANIKEGSFDDFKSTDIFKDNNININAENFENLDLKILTKGNNISIEKNPVNGKLFLEISGKNCQLKLGDLSDVYGNLCIYIRGNNTITDIGKIYIGAGGANIFNGITIDEKPSSNTIVSIGNGCSFEGLQLCCYHYGTSVTIGENCMFSGGIYLMGSDTHPAYNYETKEICNKAKYGISVGNHCWVGSSVTFLKDSAIADDCIVGWGAIVNKKFDKEHCVIAGSPAKIVKEGVTWSTQDAKLFVP